MSIRYFHPNDEGQLVPPPPISFDEDTAWWAGVQKCGATIALAAVIAATALSTAQAATVDSYHQDDPAGKLFGQYDEDFWENPVPPVQAPPPAIVFRDDDVAFTQPPPLHVDDDSRANPAPAIIADQRIPAPWIFDGGDAGNLSGQPDEDYWQNPVPPVPFTFAWPNPSQFEQHDPAGSLFGQPDEDYWQNRVRPAVTPPPPTFFTDDDVAVTPPPALQADEDFWENPVAALPGKNLPLYLWDAEEVSAATLFGQADEDYWLQLRQQPLVSLPRFFTDDDVAVAAAAPLNVDEDPLFLPRPWPSAQNVAAFSEDSAIVPQPVPLHTDEDFWVAPPARVWPPPPKLFAYDEVLFPPAPGPFVAVASSITITPTLSASSAIRQGLSVRRVTKTSSLVAKNFTIVAIL